MSETKIQFSDAELSLMCNAELILTKNKIIEKVKALLEGLQLQMMSFVYQKEELRFHPLFSIPPKISKGENYGGLPYLILDYPRNFQQAHTFSVRTFFWWGRFFSSTLQFEGDQYVALRENVQKAFVPLQHQFYFINVNKDPWQHHFEEDNYKAINDLTEEEFSAIILGQPHIKIAAKWPLTEPHLAANDLFKSWQFFLQLSGLIRQDGEKDLLPGDPKAGFDL